MRLFTNEEIREINKYTIEVEGVSSLDLIERVAVEIVEEITSRWLPSKPIAVFAGPGNNGADALAVSRILAEKGFRPAVYLFNIGGDRLSDDCKVCRDRLIQIPNVEFYEIQSNFTLPDIRREHLVIDGLFGTGFHDQVSGGFTVLIQYINDSEATVLSIDIPSGLDAVNNLKAIHRNIIHADLTFAIQFPRVAFFMKELAEIVGEWKVIDAGLSKKAIATTQSAYRYVEHEDIRRHLKLRHPFCSKADLGSLAIVGGSYGMIGATVLATKAALRSGVGKVTTYTPRCGFNILQSTVPSAMFQADKNDIVITDIHLKHDYSAIAIGPGIGVHEMTVSALDNFFSSIKKPLIIDADALNAIARRPSMLNNIPILSILTPHAGEFDRLFGQFQSDEARLKKAIEIAKTYSFFIVLKGHYTAVIRPDGTVRFNSSGTPAMATAGSGDCLAGIIGSLLAQGYIPQFATILGVYIHGIAGELAMEEQGLYGVTAEDIADNVGKAIKLIMETN